jgi:hypothetical protein
MAAMAKVMLGELLVGAGLVSEEQVLAALRGQRATGLPLGHYLVRSGILAEDELVRALSQQLGVPIIFLDGLRLPDDALRKVTADFARANLIVPFKLEGRTLHVATADPTRDELLGELRISTHCDVRFSMATPSSLDRALDRAYLARPATTGALPAPATPAGPGRTGSFSAASLSGALPGAATSSGAGGMQAAASAVTQGLSSVATADATGLAPLERRVAELEATVAKLVTTVVKNDLARREEFPGAPAPAVKPTPTRP